jgi:hypothetical protein
VDDHGVLVNVDPVTHRILLPLPWGDEGWRIWKMFRHNEAVALRGVLLARVKGDIIPIFDYNEVTRKWMLSADAYTNVDHAQAYLKAFPILISEWRKSADNYRNIKATAMQNHSKGKAKSK